MRVVNRKHRDTQESKMLFLPGNPNGQDFVDKASFGENGQGLACGTRGDSLIWSNKTKGLTKGYSKQQDNLIEEYAKRYKDGWGIIPLRIQSNFMTNVLHETGKGKWSNYCAVETDNPNLPGWCASHSRKEEIQKKHFQYLVKKEPTFGSFAVLDYLILLVNEGFIQNKETCNTIMSLDKNIANNNLSSVLYSIQNLKDLPYTCMDVLFYWKGNFTGNQVFTTKTSMWTGAFQQMPHYLIEDDSILALDAPYTTLKGKNKMKIRQLTTEQYAKKIEAKEIATVVSCFVNVNQEAMVFPSSTFVDVDSADFKALIDVKNNNHKFVVRNLFLDALKQAKIRPSRKEEWKYTLLVSNGKEIQVEGLMTELGNELFFDRFNGDGDVVDNGVCRIRS